MADALPRGIGSQITMRPAVYIREPNPSCGAKGWPDANGGMSLTGRADDQGSLRSQAKEARIRAPWEPDWKDVG
jgi:hypothetical protein